MFIRSLLDIIDGAHARKCKLTSHFGASLDYICDITFIFTIILIALYSVFFKNGKTKAKSFWIHNSVICNLTMTVLCVCIQCI